MNENQDDNEFEEDIEIDEHILEDRKKQDELTLKKNEACRFKSEEPETLILNTTEPYFRTPLTNIIESEDAYYIFVELPGLDKKKVSISLLQQLHLL